MFTLKLFNNWLAVAQEKITFYEGNSLKRRTARRLSLSQVKTIHDIIKKSRVVEIHPVYTVYQMATSPEEILS